MDITNLNTFFQQNNASDAEFNRHFAVHMKILTALVIGFFIFASDGALAQPSTAGLCSFAGWLKQLAIVAAIIALILLVINSFFAKSSLIGDIIITVIIGCVIMAAAPQIISLTGLASNCNL